MNEKNEEIKLIGSEMSQIQSAQRELDDHRSTEQENKQRM